MHYRITSVYPHSKLELQLTIRQHSAPQERKIRHEITTLTNSKERLRYGLELYIISTGSSHCRLIVSQLIKYCITACTCTCTCELAVLSSRAYLQLKSEIEDMRTRQEGLRKKRDVSY